MSQHFLTYGCNFIPKLRFDVAYQTKQKKNKMSIKKEPMKLSPHVNVRENFPEHKTRLNTEMSNY